MFPFKKPPTKFEVAKQSVSDAAHQLLDAVPTEKIEEKLGDLKKSAASAALQATQAAHHAGDLAAHKLEELQSMAAHLGEGASKTAQNVQSAGQVAATAAAAKAGVAAQTARESAQNARENLGEKAGTLRHSATESVSSFRETLKERTSHDFKIGSKEAQNAKETAEKAAQREVMATQARAEATKAKVEAKEAEIAAKLARKTANEADRQASDEAEAAKTQAVEAKKAAQLQAQAESEALALIEREKQQLKATEKESRRRARREIEERQSSSREVRHQGSGAESSEIEIAESGSKWSWILMGLALGAVAALLLAPTSGRRSRAAIKDRLGKVSDGAVDAVTATSDKVVDIAQRVEGLANKAEAKLSADGENDDDGTIADRVRSILGHHEVAKHLERLNIDCAEGVVTLRGPMLDETTQQTLIAAVGAVPGVKEVVADFLVDEEPMNPTNSVG